MHATLRYEPSHPRAYVRAPARARGAARHERRGRVVTRVLLVTGARSLADSPDAEAWARSLIRDALAGADLLIVGDAPGPDAWASEIQRAGLRRVWRLRTHGPNAGWIESAHCEEWDRVQRWAPSGASTHPIDRNRVMVATARASMLNGRAVTVLALLDGRKALARGRPTRGTEHTVGLARDAGLTVDAQTWGAT